jgi:hypothetical protein
VAHEDFRCGAQNSAALGGHSEHAAGPAGAQVRGLWTQLGHKAEAKPRPSPLPEGKDCMLGPCYSSIGLTDGRNARMGLRWAGGDTNRDTRALAQELVGLHPDSHPDKRDRSDRAAVSDEGIKVGSVNEIKNLSLRRSLCPTGVQYKWVDTQRDLGPGTR